MKLKYPPSGETRVEVSEVIIATLKRKGWIETPEDPPEPPAPLDSVENWQLEEELADRSLLASVVAAINALPAGKVRQKAQSRWAKKPFIRRSDPLITALGNALNLTAGQIDEIFTSAANRT